jgi:muramoyltetrapeptide carboxypeptidase
VLSPASTPSPQQVQRGLEHLETLGYKPVLYGHALDRGPLYYAGTREERLENFHAAFADPKIDGILCTRGGWGSAELLPYLDAELIRANPKAFIGYSDHTALHCWLQNETNLVTFYGPMVAADFAREDGVELRSWRHSVSGDEGFAVGSGEGLRGLQSGTAEGVLRGGCLSILTQSLGTPYAARTDDSVLFLEDIGTKPYQWDRMLLHLHYSGRLESARGIVFGDMAQCVATDEMEFLERVIRYSLRDFKGPIAIGLRSGHVSAPNVTLPLNVRVRLNVTDTKTAELVFLEAAVKGRVE